MKLAIMQPYFLPYIGYFQLIAAADVFVIYDNIKYTKKGWINRNRFLRNGEGATFSLPLKSDSDSLNVVERVISKDFDRDKFLNQFTGAYSRAPFFRQTIRLLEEIVMYDEHNLFHYIQHSIVRVCEYLDLKTDIRISSHISIDHSMKSQEKVLAICNALGADTYINSIGGMELYSKNDFNAQTINLKFIKSNPFVYAQLGNDFVAWLSIIDVLMFSPLDIVRNHVLNNYELI